MEKNKGFTLIELLAILFVLGIIIAVTIPNIVGISSRNKIITQVEDLKKLKSATEYKFRSDNSLTKPVNDGECVIFNLPQVDSSYFKTTPYGGEYDNNYSYVVVKRVNKRYQYFIQMVEKLPKDNGYKGVKLIASTELEKDNYIDIVTSDRYAIEDVSLTGIMPIASANDSYLGCKVVARYY